jgi:hypothetical protein
MIEQELEVPFETAVLGVTVLVKKLDITEAGEIMAVCYRGRGTGRRSRFSSSRCPIHRRRGGSGSRRTAAGYGDAELVKTEILDQ